MGEMSYWFKKARAWPLRAGVEALKAGPDGLGCGSSIINKFVPCHLPLATPPPQACVPCPCLPDQNAWPHALHVK